MNAPQFVLPIIIARAAGADPATVGGLLGLALIANAIATLFLCARTRLFGAGLLVPTSFTAIYLAPCLAIAPLGLPVVAGMTMLAGLAEVLLGLVLGRLRALFPQEVTGLVIVVIGMMTGETGLGFLVSTDGGVAPEWIHIATGLVALSITAGLAVWGRGTLRQLAPLLGIVCGYGFHALAGGLSPGDVAAVMAAPWFAPPMLPSFEYRIEPAAIPAFLIAALAAVCKTIGTLAFAQRVNDRGWVRADMRGVARGTAADGLGTMAAGLLGVTGLNASTQSIALAAATGVTSRVIGPVVALVLLGMAMVPKMAIALATMPRPVMGAALLFSATYILVAGVQVVGSRLTDVRRALTLGLPLALALGARHHAALGAMLPAPIAWLVESPLLIATVSALVLNLVFSIGSRRVIQANAATSQQARLVLDQAGAAWGARRDVIERAGDTLAEAVELALDLADGRGPVSLRLAFDELNLDIAIDYAGPPPRLGAARPSAEAVRDSEDGLRDLAGFLIMRGADDVKAVPREGGTRLSLRFVH